MPPIVYAFTGLWRGMVRMRTPSVITIVLPLSHDSESRFLKRPHRVQVVDARDLRHRSARDFNFSDRGTPEQILACGEVLADGIPDVL